ncbi:hypothetical protein QJS10_CPA16g00752 [Acorus calamus]|uniref:Uncharacterized protein n=1 Tax=Acorus calamus TaxID=4465 RepID=A0AAV9D0A4_ACOCL|nr:hypothetical protein QJS10_CPA16g00752 [Acorus calamus]
METGRRLQQWSREQDITLATANMYGLLPGEDRTFANTILLRLAEAFRRGDRRIRALSLRLLGCWADFAKDSAEIRFMVISSLRSGDDFSEVKAALFAAGCMCELSEDFACVILGMLVNIVTSLEMPFDVKRAAVRTLGRMRCSAFITNRAYKIASMVKQSSHGSHGGEFSEVTGGCQGLLGLILRLVEEYPTLGFMVLDKIKFVIKDLVRISGEVPDKENKTQNPSFSLTGIAESVVKHDSCFTSELVICICRFMDSCLEILDEAGAVTSEVNQTLKPFLEQLHQSFFYRCDLYVIVSLLFRSQIMWHYCGAENNVTFEARGDRKEVEVGSSVVLSHDVCWVDHEWKILEFSKNMMERNNYWTLYRLGKYSTCQGAWFAAAFTFRKLIDRVQSHSCRCWLRSLMLLAGAESEIKLFLFPKQGSQIIIGLQRNDACRKPSSADEEEDGRGTGGHDELHYYQEKLESIYGRICSGEKTLTAISTSDGFLYFQRWFLNLRAKVLEVLVDILGLLVSCICCEEKINNDERMKKYSKCAMELQSFLGEVGHVNSNIQSRTRIHKTGYKERAIVSFSRSAISKVLHLQEMANGAKDEHDLCKFLRAGLQLLSKLIKEWMYIPFEAPKYYFQARPCVGAEIFIFNANSRDRDEISVICGFHLSLNLCIQFKNATPHHQSKVSRMYCIIAVSPFDPLKATSGETIMENGFRGTDELVDLNESAIPFLVFTEVSFTTVLSTQALYSWGGKDCVKKLIVISTLLAEDIEVQTNILMDAAEQCTSVEFVMLEQEANPCEEASEKIKSFINRISGLENCSLRRYLPDSWILCGLVKRWLRDLKDDVENPLQAIFLFKNNLVGSADRILCNLFVSSNQLIDGFTSCQKLAASEEVLPVPEVIPSTDSFLPKEMQDCIQTSLFKSNPTTKANQTKSRTNLLDPLKSSTQGPATEAQDEEIQPTQTGASEADDTKSTPCIITEDWGNLLIVNDVSESSSQTIISKPKFESQVSTTSVEKPLDEKTCRILERLEAPKEKKLPRGRTISPPMASVRSNQCSGSMKRPLVPLGPSSSQLLKPDFQRLKRKHSFQADLGRR